MTLISQPKARSAEQPPAPRNGGVWPPLWRGATLTLASAALAGCVITMPPAQVASEVPAQWHAPLPHAGAVADLSRWWQNHGDATLTAFIDVELRGLELVAD
ncbi:MAG TPA: hypothetical protein PK347_13320, partial [Burkholderiaceae bacterium]|nr:hypothetical protein [Burkholderiaceae bacterium]